jgi:hypothetical protein
MLIVGFAVTTKLLVTEAVPATLVAVTLKLCGPGVNAFGPCGLAQEDVAASLSHWHVTVAAEPPPSVKLAVTGDPTISPSVGEGIATVGGAITVKLRVTDAVPATFEAVTVTLWGPGARVLGPRGLAQDVAASLSQWQVTLDAAPPPNVKVAVTGDPTISLAVGDVIATVGGAMTVKVRVTDALPATFAAVTLKLCDPGARVLGPWGPAQDEMAASPSH